MAVSVFAAVMASRKVQSGPPVPPDVLVTVMLAAISAESRHARESLSTLRYAARTLTLALALSLVLTLTLTRYAARAKTITNTKVRRD